MLRPFPSIRGPKITAASQKSPTKRPKWVNERHFRANVRLFLPGSQSPERPAESENRFQFRRLASPKCHYGMSAGVDPIEVGLRKLRRFDLALLACSSIASTAVTPPFLGHLHACGSSFSSARMARWASFLTMPSYWLPDPAESGHVAIRATECFRAIAIAPVLPDGCRPLSPSFMIEIQCFLQCAAEPRFPLLVCADEPQPRLGTEMQTTACHSFIRGLDTAFPLFRPGLPDFSCRASGRCV